MVGSRGKLQLPERLRSQTKGTNDREPVVTPAQALSSFERDLKLMIESALFGILADLSAV